MKLYQFTVPSLHGTNDLLHGLVLAATPKRALKFLCDDDDWWKKREVRVTTPPKGGGIVKLWVEKKPAP